MIAKKIQVVSPWLLFPLLFSACATTTPKEALQLSPESLKLRQLQTKSFDTDEIMLLTSSASLLQDLGFNIEETSSELGVLTSSKRRDATSTAQLMGSVFVALLTGVPTSVDKEQLIRASVVTHPINIDKNDKSKNKTAVRVTFQRVVTNTQGQITRQECIIDEQIYKEFFDKLSKSLFLEANDI